MKYIFEINQRLPSLNEYIKACNTHWNKGRELKSDTEEMICWEIKRQLRGVKIDKPVKIHYTWVEHNKKRDRDNVESAKKFVQDALVKMQVIKNDTAKLVVDSTDIIVYANKSKVIVEICEI